MPRATSRRGLTAASAAMGRGCRARDSSLSRRACVGGARATVCNFCRRPELGVCTHSALPLCRPLRLLCATREQLAAAALPGGDVRGQEPRAGCVGGWQIVQSTSFEVHARVGALLCRLGGEQAVLLLSIYSKPGTPEGDHAQAVPLRRGRLKELGALKVELHGCCAGWKMKRASTANGTSSSTRAGKTAGLMTGAGRQRRARASLEE